MNNNISTTIATLASTVNNDLKEYISVAQEFDSELLNLFESANEKIKDAVNLLKEAAKVIEKAKSRAEKLTAFDNSKDENPVTVTAYTYLFSTKEHFDGSKGFCRAAARLGINIGLTFEEGEEMIRFVCAEPERWTEDYSWQDHHLPKKVQQLLALGEDDPSYAPGFIPARIAREIAEKGEVVLTPVNGGGKLHIRLIPCPNQEKDFRETFEAIVNN